MSNIADIYDKYNDIIYILGLLIDIICDYLFFYLITPINRSKKQNIVFIVVTFPIIFLYGGGGELGVLISEFFQVLTFYIVYKRKKKDYQVLGRLLILVLYSYLFFEIETIFSLIIVPYIRVSSLGIIFINILEYYILTKTNIVKNLDDEYGKTYFFLIIYLLTSFAGIYYLTSYLFKVDKVLYLILLVVIALQLIFSLYIYNSSKKIRQDKLNIQQIKDLKIYTQQLESSQRKLRKFKHDYQNMLLSLSISAKKNHDKELVDKLAEYSNKTLEDKVLWQFNDIDNIKDDLLKSLLISKLNRIFQDNIQYTFECRNIIEKLSDEYDSFDIIRMLGIAYDNAIEESLKLGDEAKIDTMIYQENGKLEIEIKNRCRDMGIAIQDMKKSGFTTKKNHQGLGLANIEEIRKRYDDILLNYQIKDGWFTFLIVMSV
ncbi:AbpK sensory transduction histidine kinase [Ligilactobacillus salivarius GJ-24]|uniref:AbpK sensory transduction histidine kinase n=1 Tax=Ligilactobacillus salivarius GJ-24 TaxID=1041521 RepID=F7QWF8_9LACO|nr:GHKL domain-containing protein [Ligilactobacillus salivarius]EGM49651.1 AbpK sensory transduction histidine kinase [Ligilactobacillus salivarius GJ-24]